MKMTLHQTRDHLAQFIESMRDKVDEESHALLDRICPRAGGVQPSAPAILVPSTPAAGNDSPVLMPPSDQSTL